MQVIGYVRVSTNKQEVGPEVQIAALEREAERQGWTLELRREDAASAASMRNRPVLEQALADLKAGRADMLAVSKLDRLSRSVADFARLLDDAQCQGWHVACLDINVDTTESTGALMAHVTVSFAEFERRRIGERTREAMARIKAETGKHMGRPTLLNPAIDARIRAMSAEGMTQQAICDALMAEGIPTATGKPLWRQTAISQILRRPAPRDERFSDWDPNDVPFVPQTWDEWWASIQWPIQHGVDPAMFQPPLHLLESGVPRPAYTLPQS